MPHLKTEHISGPRVCDPTSQESLDSLIKLAKNWLGHTENDARQVFGYLARIRNHVRWKKSYDSGGKTWDDFCEEHLGRPAEYFEWVKIGIECADGEISVKEAAQLGKKELNRRQKAAKKAETIRRIAQENPQATQQQVAELFQEETGEACSRSRVSEVVDESGNLPISSTLTIEQEAAETGGSPKTIRLQRKLQKVRPDLYDEVVNGSKTLNAACVAAGIVKKLGPLEQMLKLLPKLTEEEKEILVSHILKRPVSQEKL